MKNLPKVATQLCQACEDRTHLYSLDSGQATLLKLLSDILNAADRGDVAALIRLNMSAAFDTVDQSILLQRLQSTFGIHDTAHQ